MVNNSPPPKPLSRRTALAHFRLFWLLTATVAVLTWWPFFQRLQARHLAADRSQLLYAASQCAANANHGEPDIQKYMMRVYTSENEVITHQNSHEADVTITVADTRQFIRVALARDQDGHWQGLYAIKSKRA